MIDVNVWAVVVCDGGRSDHSIDVQNTASKRLNLITQLVFGARYEFADNECAARECAKRRAGVCQVTPHKAKPSSNSFLLHSFTLGAQKGES
jgi:hypothetical protein